jgi:hypothetical protein
MAWFHFPLLPEFASDTGFTFLIQFINQSRDMVEIRLSIVACPSSGAGRIHSDAMAKQKLERHLHCAGWTRGALVVLAEPVAGRAHDVYLLHLFAQANHPGVNLPHGSNFRR